MNIIEKQPLTEEERISIMRNMVKKKTIRKIYSQVYRGFTSQTNTGIIQNVDRDILKSVLPF